MPILGGVPEMAQLKHCPTFGEGLQLGKCDDLKCFKLPVCFPI